MWPLWQAACVGQTVFNPGEAKNTYGTGCFMLMQTGDRCSSRATCNKQRTTGDTQRGPPPAHLMPCAPHSARQRLGARRLSEGSPNGVVNDRPFWLPAAHACASALGHRCSAVPSTHGLLTTVCYQLGPKEPVKCRPSPTHTHAHTHARTLAHPGTRACIRTKAYAPRHARAHTQVCA